MADKMVKDVYVRVNYVSISFTVGGPLGAAGYTVIWLSELPAWMARHGEDVVQVLSVVPV